MSVVETNPTPEDYRKRYFELKQQAERKNTERVAVDYQPNPSTIPPASIVLKETVPPGSYWTGRIACGRSLRIANSHGAAGVSALFWNADDPSERYNAGDTVKVQWSTQLSRGRLLLSDMGRVIASITDDICGAHDFIVGGSTPASNARKYGAGVGGGGYPNAHDNFVVAAAKHGLGPRDVGPCVSFFAPVTVDEGGRFVWRSEHCHSGTYVDLRAEMNLIVALSNCPHPLSPATNWTASPVDIAIWRSPPATESDFCRSATDEAIRAFENTDAATRV